MGGDLGLESPLGERCRFKNPPALPVGGDEGREGGERDYSWRPRPGAAVRRQGETEETGWQRARASERAVV